MDSFINCIKNLLDKPNLTIFLLIAFILLFLLVGTFIGYLSAKIKFHSEIKRNRKDAVNRSRSVLTGQISEQLAPYLPNFPCSPECVQFLGKPVDFIGFVSKDQVFPLEERKIDEILFIEIKTGNAVQSKREKEVQKAIEEGRVRYTVCRM
ncbi:MAG: Holliday junction resolvase [Treponemataceae bacterium]|nr:Holliday junction resolvase [Treponemataceae bacterium]